MPVATGRLSSLAPSFLLRACKQQPRRRPYRASDSKGHMYNQKGTFGPFVDCTVAKDVSPLAVSVFC